jgi:hypothetical protein
VVDRAVRDRHPLASDVFDPVDTRAGLADQGHRQIGAAFDGRPVVGAENLQLHSPQLGADHRHADLNDLDFAGLKGVQRVHAGREGIGDHDVETPLLEEAAFLRRWQADLVDPADEAGFDCA